MTKIEQARQLMTNNPKITPVQMSEEMGLPIKQVYLLRSQAKASMKKGGGKRKGPIQRFMEQHAREQAAVPQGWDDADNTPTSYRVGAGMLNVTNKPEPINPLLAKMDRLREELADARAVIKYLEKKLYEKTTGNGPSY